MLRTALRALLKTRALGYRPSPEDKRDHALLSSRAALPESALDLDRWVAYARNQGPFSACTSHAIDHAVQAVCGERRGPHAHEYTPRSVRDPYYTGRALAGLQREDGGAYLRDVIKAFSHLGSPPEAVSPLRIATINKQPGPDSYRQGISWRGLKYSRVLGTGLSLVQGIHAALVARKPVVIGIEVDSDFLDDDGNDLIGPQNRADIVGGHAMLVSGFEAGGDRSRLVNSWGTDWRDHGRAWVSRGFLAQAREAWAIEGWS